MKTQTKMKLTQTLKGYKYELVTSQLGVTAYVNGKQIGVYKDAKEASAAVIRVIDNLEHARTV